LRRCASITTGLISVGVLGFCCLFFASIALLRLRGKTIVDETGFTVGFHRIPWKDVVRIQFATTGPLRTVRILRAGTSVVARGLVDQPLHDPRYEARIAEVRAAGTGRTEIGDVKHSAVLSGILVVFFPVLLAGLQFGIVDTPWEDEPWWPGLDIATSTPDACGALSTEDARRLVPDGTVEAVYGEPDGISGFCRRTGSTGQVDVEVSRERWGDLIAEAGKEFRREADGAAEAVPGLGDEAVVEAAGSKVHVVVRRGNVVVEVEFRDDARGEALDTGSFAANRGAVVEVARSAAAAVDLR